MHQFLKDLSPDFKEIRSKNKEQYGRYLLCLFSNWSYFIQIQILILVEEKNSSSIGHFRFLICAPEN